MVILFTGGDMTKTELFCGKDSHGISVTASELDDFVTKIVIPRFPKGFTMVNATGVYGSDKGTIREDTIVFVFIHDDDRENHLINDVAENYKVWFDQECVLRVDTPVNVQFV